MFTPWHWALVMSSDACLPTLLKAAPPATLTAGATFFLLLHFFKQSKLCVFLVRRTKQAQAPPPRASLSPFIPLSAGSHTFAQALAPWQPKSVLPLAAVPPLSFPLVRTDRVRELGFWEGEDVLHLVPVEGVESPLYALEINPEKSMEEFRAASQKLGDGVDDMEFGWRIVLGSFTGFCRAAFGSVGGVGGGGIFVPMLSLIISFDPKSSTAISKCMIMGAALSTVYYNLRLRHPTLDMPIIDYDLALLIQPMLMLGINIGVTFNVLFPDWMVTILLIVIFVVTSTKAFFKGVETWKKETIMKKDVSDIRQVPDHQ
ncbi:hypothetical protein HN51_012080, partial [Arachis hypogaea]